MKNLFLLFLFIPGLLQAQILDNSHIQEPPSMYINPTSLSGLSSNAGTQGLAVGYTLTWYQWPGSTITITAPTGYVVSTDSSTWSTSGGSKTYTPSSIAGSVRLYTALAAGNVSGIYTGNITHTASGVTYAPSLAVSGSTSTVASLSVAPTSLTLTDTAGTSGHPQTLTATFSSLSGNVNVTVPTAPVPLELSINGGSTWSSSQSFSTGSPLAVLVRVTSGASAGTIVDTVAFATTGVSTIKIPIGGTVSSGGSFATIVIQSSKVSGTQTNFPVLISGTYTQLKGTSFGGTVTSRNNIVLSSNSAGTSLLPFEIEKYDSSTGQIVAWTQVPSVSSSSNTTIYMLYGNLGYSSFQGGTYGSVWGSNAYAIWHMSETLNGATAQTVYDWGPNNHPLTTRGTWTTGEQSAGIIGGAITSSGSNYFGFAQKTIGTTGDYTISGWYNIPATFNSNQFSFADSGTVSGAELWWPGGPLHANLYINYPVNVYAITDPNTTSASTWTYITVTRVSGTYTIYNNGVSTATNANTNALNFNSIGNYDAGGTPNPMNATGLDEQQIWNIGVPTGWPLTSYNNQSSPSTFYTISF